jgi:hypothetical protein
MEDDLKTQFSKAFEWTFDKLNQPFTLPRFRGIIKLHKSGPIKARPISGAVNWITTAPSMLATLLLHDKVIAGYPTIIRDSKAFIRNIEGLIIPENSLLVSFDVVSLYTNMQTDVVIKILELNPSIQPGLLRLIEWILSNSYIQFKDEIYYQHHGMPMGTNAAVAIAQLFLYYGVDQSNLIQAYSQQNLLHHWRRFIDDIFCVWSGSEESLNLLHNQLNDLIPGISFTVVKSQSSLEILDTVIFKSKDSNGITRLFSRLHQKELNSYAYIPAASHHDHALLKGWIKGELIRYIRNSSREVDYLTIKKIFRERLILRGYPLKWIHNVFISVFYKDRQLYLDQHPPSKQNSMVMVINSSERQRNLKLGSLLRTYLQDVNSYAAVRGIYPVNPTIALRSGSPLRRFLYKSLTPNPLTFRPTDLYIENSDSEVLTSSD